MSAATARGGPLGTTNAFWNRGQGSQSTGTQPPEKAATSANTLLLIKKALLLFQMWKNRLWKRANSPKSAVMPAIKVEKANKEEEEKLEGRSKAENGQRR